jgi:hypothetical protein
VRCDWRSHDQRPMPEMVHERALIEKKIGQRASKREDSNLDIVLARINLFAVPVANLVGNMYI